MPVKPSVLTCPLCLQSDEPDSMLTVAIRHALLGESTQAVLCRACVLAISDAAYNSDLFNSEEARRAMLEATQIPGGPEPAPAPQASESDKECNHPSLYVKDGECSICHVRVGY